MTRHILDKPRIRDDGHRAQEYARINREKGDERRDPAVTALHRARPAATGKTRTRIYHEIERRSD